MSDTIHKPWQAFKTLGPIPSQQAIDLARDFEIRPVYRDDVRWIVDSLIAARAALSSPPAPAEGEREATEKDRAYASLVKVVDRYVAFCHQAGVEANASSLDPTEQLHAQSIAALARARVAAYSSLSLNSSSPVEGRCLAAVCDCRDHKGDSERDILMGHPSTPLLDMEPRQAVEEIERLSAIYNAPPSASPPSAPTGGYSRELSDALWGPMPPSSPPAATCAGDGCRGCEGCRSDSTSPSDAAPPAVEEPRRGEDGMCPDRREHGRCDHFECIEERRFRARRAPAPAPSAGGAARASCACGRGGQTNPWPVEPNPADSTLDGVIHHPTGCAPSAGGEPGHEPTTEEKTDGLS